MFSQPTGHTSPLLRGVFPAEWSRSVRVERVCLSCGSDQVERPHPLFTGGLCLTCERAARDTMFALAEDNISVSWRRDGGWGRSSFGI